MEVFRSDKRLIVNPCHLRAVTRVCGKGHAFVAPGVEIISPSKLRVYWQPSPPHGQSMRNSRYCWVLRLNWRPETRRSSCRLVHRVRPRQRRQTSGTPEHFHATAQHHDHLIGCFTFSTPLAEFAEILSQNAGSLSCGKSAPVNCKRRVWPLCAAYGISQHKVLDAVCGC